MTTARVSNWYQIGWTAQVREQNGEWSKSHAIVVWPSLGSRVRLACRTRGYSPLMPKGPAWPVPADRCQVCERELAR